ncbi:MAG: hypothetical protein HUJ76_00640 [Parasporobacterium sp.]|nr:hypothetical protein [Parasporobacterium sp.]
MKKLLERFRIYRIKKPNIVILLVILLFNICWFFFSAALISAMAPSSLAHRGFWDSVYYTITMILDAGCIEYVIADIGAVSVGLIIFCVIVVIVGMITFSGAVIGYVTNYISGFIENADSGNTPIKISGHIVILNWNDRAAEIINELLFKGRKERIIVLANADKKLIEQEIYDRVSDTVSKENAVVKLKARQMSPGEGRKYIKEHTLKNRLDIIVREGDSCSTKQLQDISLKSARMVIILENDIRDSADNGSGEDKGNSNTIKALIQVADFTAQEGSAEDQHIVVETGDDWTLELVNKIIRHKEKSGKCNILPITVNHMLGLLLAQFCIMPELNKVYYKLYSNKGAGIFARPYAGQSDIDTEPGRYISVHDHAIPITVMDTGTGSYAYYVADRASDADIISEPSECNYSIKYNNKFWLRQRNILILGHNSRMEEIMNGFYFFREEWNGNPYEDNPEDILNIMVIDDEKSLAEHNYYKEYPYVNRVISTGLYNDKLIHDSITEFVSLNADNTTVLILSDDLAKPEDIDAQALTCLVYIQEILEEKQDENPEFDAGKIDVIVEILNPKNYDVANNYSRNNVVISNRYASKMTTQICEKGGLFDLFRYLMTFGGENAEEYDSKELYIKDVKDFFLETPAPCTAKELITAVYNASPSENKQIVIGSVCDNKIKIFAGNQREIKVELTENDKLIIFCAH